MAEVPIPTYGYMGEDEFYPDSKDDMVNYWAVDTLEGLIHTDRQ